MVCLVLNGDVEKLKAPEVLVERLVKLFPSHYGKHFLQYQSGKDQCHHGKRDCKSVRAGLYHRLYRKCLLPHLPTVLYQVNPVQTQKLYGTALEYAGLTGEETVWDLYCGIGTISLFLAQKAKKVYGVEIIPQAIDDARANAKLNHFENVEFFVGKAEEVLPEQYEKNQVYADTIVVDPPRKGCDSVCLDTIVKMAPEKVVYVSCDSATLARDVKYLGREDMR